MGKRSVKENKNMYQIGREEAGYTRAQASEEMGFVSAERIEKIESEKSAPHPEEVLAMARCYKDVTLCNRYCSRECPIGQEYIPEIELKDLTQITLETLSNLNSLEKEKDRFIEIAADSRVDSEEYEDFIGIKEKLEKISIAANSLSLWMEQEIQKGTFKK